MQVLILDPGLMTPIGHHWNLDRGLIRELRRSGVAYRLFCALRADGQVVQGLGAEPHFRFHPYETLAVLSRYRDFDAFLEFNARAYGDLMALNRRLDYAESLIVVHTTVFRMLHGIARWLAAAPLPASSRLALIFPHESGLGEPSRSEREKAAFYRQGFAGLNRAAGTKVELYTLSAKQSAEFGELAGRPVPRLPYPSTAVAWRRDHGTPRREARRKRRVLFCGESTIRKGFQLLPEIIAEVGNRRSDVEFVVQLNGWELNQSGIEAFETFARRRYDTRCLKGFVPEEDYYRLMDDADLLLLPYQSSAYRSGTSAVFEEAMYLGKPTVVPPDTMMAEALAACPDAGRVADGHTVGAYAAAIDDVLDRFDRYAEGARRAASIYAARDGIDRFAEALLRRPAGT
jgi:glycosyltransferase involved in cell wall biosynthesis